MNEREAANCKKAIFQRNRLVHEHEKSFVALHTIDKAVRPS